MRNKQRCECAHEGDLTRQGALNGEDVTRSGADKAKRPHDIDDKGRNKRSDDGVSSGDDVTRSRKRGAARSGVGANQARLRGCGKEGMR